MEYSERFLDAFNHVLLWEGGAKITEASFDGHITKYGIIQETYSRYFRGKDVRNCTEEEAMYIYYVGFWRFNRLDEINNFSVADFIFQGCVNMGNAGFVKNCLQYPLGLIVDGIIGRQTLSKINGNSKEAYDKIYSATEDRYNRLATGDKKRFLKGWLNRIKDYKYKAV